ncbi:class I adenylate-forming enzyme family protein [Streptomyces sp. NK08204]|uniref:class I adenylate-forming enzyme family protein n=1 Tax=Streptomyces sp. NK08204 TaxID=2873260 RepID=UPI001CEC1634|nr:AMP-binding protein [Streptomyces sp. NK08204]
MWLTQLLERNRQCFGDRVALADARRSLTWAELAHRAEALSVTLGALGVRHGDRVAVLSRDRVEVLETYFALGRIGALFVPVDPALVPGEVAEITEHAKVAGIIGESELLERLDTAPGTAGPDAPWRLSFDDSRHRDAATTSPAAAPASAGEEPVVRADDPVAVLYTSATAGHPKGVVVDHRSVKDIALGWLAVAAPPAEAVLVTCCPLFHGTVVLTLAHLAAGTTVVIPGSDAPPKDIVASAQQHRATHLWLVPETLRALLDHLGTHEDAALPDSLTEVLYGAAPMPVGLYAAAARTLGCGFRQVYGLTEAGGPFVTLAPAEHPDPHGDLPDALPVGRVIPGMSVRIADDAGRPLPTGERGEILVRGDGRMRGYWRDPAATDEALVTGWLRTGDIGHLDETGCLHLLDRKTDLIIRNGRNVYPAEIERVLRRHPAVADTAVVGVADPVEGEVPLALVVLAPGAQVSRDDIMSHLAARTAAYKTPKDVQIVETLPRNSAGKVQKRLITA